MIQLRVYEEYVTPWTSASPKYLDLYETQPIKLNLSIEDITNADATSTFSRTSVYQLLAKTMSSLKTHGI